MDPADELLEKLSRLLSEDDRFVGAGAIATSSTPGVADIQVCTLQPGPSAPGAILRGSLVVDALLFEDLVLTMLQDANGDFIPLVIKRAVTQSVRERGRLDYLYPQGASVAVREPELVEHTGHRFILRQHPGQVRVVSFFTRSQVESFKAMPLLEFRLKVDDMLKDGLLAPAVEAYMLVLKEAELLGNKLEMSWCWFKLAECFHKLRRFEDCVNAADKALQLDPIDGRIAYWKASGLMHLGLYDWALQVLRPYADRDKALFDTFLMARKLAKQSHRGCIIDDEISLFLLKVAEVDVDPQHQAEVPRQPELGEYIGPVELKVRDDGDRVGLFAARDISKGEVLITTNGVSHLWRHAQSGVTGGDLLPDLLDMASKSPRSYQQIRSAVNSKSVTMETFSPNWSTPEKWSNSRDPGTRAEVDDAFVAEVEMRFESKAPGGGDIWWLWPLPGLFTRACMPSVCITQFRHSLCAVASRSIAAGEELALEERGVFGDATSERWRCACEMCGFLREHAPESMDSSSLNSLEAFLMEGEMESRNEAERRVFRGFYARVYSRYYGMVGAGKLHAPGFPAAEVIMEALHGVSLGNNIGLLDELARFASDRDAAERIIRDEIESKFGILDDYVYGTARENLIRMCKRGWFSGFYLPGKRWCPSCISIDSTLISPPPPVEIHIPGFRGRAVESTV